MSIKLVRVDHRLIHGQVGFTWTKFLQTNCILIASDTIMQDPLKMTAMKMAVPTGVKLVMKSIDDSIAALNSGVTDKYSLLILCESIEDVAKLASQVPLIKEINLGGMKDGADRKQVSKSVHLSADDIELIQQLLKTGVELTVQMVPDEQAVDIRKLI
ncbi:PTS system mannose/fructose/N-acetylgalactosamine-transporter subunit IIB [Carnobacterium maltaromaticum]|uniref:PTS system mannose/fructose/N-acetylgalactosamine-transporter subunit IIB n=1 Tax=Carnobacterium maltaromaticum TaxID=2751 RepID=UPI0007053502|nr:PTS sugar transporter subunit IIB [Carnobacterium maltaromaticum]KRN73821.1 PTS family ascorbate porter, IIB component [Carnobacterium maltaromaticum]MBC9808290.1 PTS mannose/fructose/sorbose transporter subunit IIB [Carnobacterium maltaromaticum]MCC4313222.1 PTS sugar transporter [Carnobacterium maltaromaticum]CRH19361.1 PTS system sorbose subIIB component family protein [Carnobacterium maltaromaticum]CRH22224.1 PTS system sorbose subIIB component family protein [Carnobacterium maltaromati